MHRHSMALVLSGLLTTATTSAHPPPAPCPEGMTIDPIQMVTFTAEDLQQEYLEWAIAQDFSTCRAHIQVNPELVSCGVVDAEHFANVKAKEYCNKFSLSIGMPLISGFILTPSLSPLDIEAKYQINQDITLLCGSCQLSELL